MRFSLRAALAVIIVLAVAAAVGLRRPIQHGIRYARLLD